jgi:hypothetical protein
MNECAALDTDGIVLDGRSAIGARSRRWEIQPGAGDPREGIEGGRPGREAFCEMAAHRFRAKERIHTQNAATDETFLEQDM